MTQNVSVNEFLQNLKTFYDLCVHNNIELIVVIPPPNFINLTRRQKMYNLYLAEKSFLEKYGIKYVNMYEYVDNLYKTLYKSHIQLQTDNTHFNDYTCWKDAFLKYITPFVYNQTNKINYVQIDNNRNYSQTNGVITNVSDNVSIFQYGILFKKENQNTNKIEININLKEDSVIYINSYSNNRSGKFDVTIDNNNLLKNTFNTYNSINGGTYSKDYIINLQIPHILKAGMHNILINNPDYSENSEINRIYIFGLIIKSIDSLNIKKSSTSFQTKQQLTLYNGYNSNIETTNFLKDIKNCNEIHILTGDSINGFTTTIIRPVDIYRNFYENTILNFIAPNTNNEPSIAKMTINIEDNTFTYTSTGIPLRRIYGYINPNTKKYNPFLENDFSAEQNYTI